MMNRAGLDMIEATSFNQVRDQCVLPMVAEEHRAYFQEMLAKVFQGWRQSIEFKMTSLKGNERWLFSQAVPQYDESGRVISALSITLDITRRKQAEEKISLSETRLKESQEVAKIGSWNWDLINNTLEWSAETFRRFDKDSATFVPTVEYFVSLIHPADRTEIERSIQQTIESDAAYHIQPRIINDNGREWILEGFGRVERDGQGRPLRFAGTAQDITERKRSEEDLRKSEERFQLAMQGANDGLWDWNLNTNEVYYSPRWKSMLGYAPNELEHTLDTWKRLVHPDDRERTLVLVHDLLEGRSDKFEVEFRMRHKDGGFRHILSRAFLAIGFGGQSKRLVGTHVDITDRKLTEEKLARLNAQNALILSSAAEGILGLNIDGDHIFVNPAAARMLGYETEDLIGRPSHQTWHHTRSDGRPYPQEECEIYAAYRDCKVHHALNEIFWKKDGTSFPVEYLSTPIFEQGRVAGAVVTFTDITDRKRLDEERLRNQKLESLGVMAGGIAHDFNNLLTGIQGNISLALLKSDRTERERLLSEAIKAVERSTDLTGKLQVFAKGDTPKLAIGSLCKIIRESSEFSVGKNSPVNCDYDLPDDLWMVEVDQKQIGRVVQNLVINAKQAMATGGTVHIRAENVSLPDRNAYSLPAGRFIRISISDTGVGIPEKHLHRIFDPYFTTKGDGSGLGLAVSLTLIKNHNGAITAESEPGKGTTFHFLLPATAKTATKTKAAADRDKVAHNLKILVMDDDPMIRDVLRNMLQLNHQVELSQDGQEALEKYAEALRTGKPFDLIILDMNVPGGMGGMEAFHKIREINPSATAVVSSGYSGSLPEGFDGILPKPYDFNKLNNLIQEIFSRK